MVVAESHPRCVRRVRKEALGLIVADIGCTSGSLASNDCHRASISSETSLAMLRRGYAVVTIAVSMNLVVPPMVAA